MNRCDNCDRPYRRRNLTEAWVKQAPGKRAGWVKKVQRICTWCQDETNSRRVLILSANRVLDVKKAMQRRRAG